MKTHTHSTKTTRTDDCLLHAREEVSNIDFSTTYRLSEGKRFFYNSQQTFGESDLSPTYSELSTASNMADATITAMLETMKAMFDQQARDRQKLTEERASQETERKEERQKK